MLRNPHLFGFELSWYWLLLSAAIIISIGVFFLLERKKPSKGILWQKLAIVYGMIIVGFFFGRAFSMFEHYIGSGEFPSFKEFLVQFKTWPASRWYGALTAGFIYLEILRFFFRNSSLNWGQYFSNIATSVCLGIAIGKIGCFLDGHIGCGGIATTLPWGVHYPFGTAANSVAMHPVQMYDFIAYVSIFLILLYFQRKGNIDVYRIFFLAVSLYNLPVELIISNTIFLPGHLSLGQYIYCFLFVTSAIPLLWNYNRNKYARVGNT